MASRAQPIAIPRRIVRSLSWPAALDLAPGVALASTIAAAARFASDNNGGPPMVYALALGLSLGFVAAEPRCRAGLAWSANSIMRFGVALLGLQLSVSDLVALGPLTAVLIAGCVMLAILIGTGVGKLLKLPTDVALLGACATAICGATAAMAIITVLPRRQELERSMCMIIGTIAMFSTVAMLCYPAGLTWLGFDHRAIGFMLGATIHDVAQVVSSGYSVSDEAGAAATIVKLMRVACLLPAVLVIGLIYRKRHLADAAERPALLPWFMILFVALMAINSAGYVPAPAVEAGKQISRWCLLVAIAALGVRTSTRELAAEGSRPVIMLLGQATLLIGLAFGAVEIMRR